MTFAGGPNKSVNGVLRFDEVGDWPLDSCSLA